MLGFAFPGCFGPCPSDVTRVARRVSDERDGRGGNSEGVIEGEATGE